MGATVYISLGSNVGDRQGFLQQAVDALFTRVGNIRAVSPVYETPAQGFEGSNFYNACLEIHTDFEPDDLLKICLEIETSMGRKRTKEKGYQSREIDIDILFYNRRKWQSDLLEIPHPHFSLRDFVLYPLADIAPDFIDPLSEKKIKEILAQAVFSDKITQTAIRLTNPVNNYHFNQKYIVIEGNIGSGKTTLATQMANDFNGKLVLERFADNPFLPKFYSKPRRYAFPLELSFLADRYQQFTADLAQFDLFSECVIADYDIYKSLIFSKVTLTQDEFLLYKKFFDIIYKDAPKPDIYVYLYQSTEQLLENIRKRGRSFEQNIQPEYLQKINEGYMAYLRSRPKEHTLIINMSELDFVKNRNDYLYLLEKINQAIKTKQQT